VQPVRGDAVPPGAVEHCEGRGQWLGTGHVDRRRQLVGDPGQVGEARTPRRCAGSVPVDDLIGPEIHMDHADVRSTLRLDVPVARHGDDRQFGLLCQRPAPPVRGTEAGHHRAKPDGVLGVGHRRPEGVPTMSNPDHVVAGERGSDVGPRVAGPQDPRRHHPAMITQRPDDVSDSHARHPAHCRTHAKRSPDHLWKSSSTGKWHGEGGKGGDAGGGRARQGQLACRSCRPRRPHGTSP
jgi:hypothetical protein